MRTPNFQTSIPPIQQGAEGDDLVASLNDRFRRIELGLNQQTIVRSGPVTPPGPPGGTWIEEIPAGLLNGSNRVFSLSNTPIAGSLTLFLNIVQMESADLAVDGGDFSISGGTITFAVAPKARDTGYFLARYQH